MSGAGGPGTAGAPGAGTGRSDGVDAPAGAPVIGVVAAVVVDDDGRHLLVRKRGTVAFMQVGGKIEPGEDPRDALVREIAEEVGVVVAGDDVTHRGTWHGAAANEPGHGLVAEVYDVRGVVGPRAAAEIAELVWADPADPGALVLAPLTRDLLRGDPLA